MGIVSLIVAAIVGVILYAIQSAAVRAPGESLRNKFVELGTLSGKKLQDITAVCGAPNAVSAVGDKRILRQWYATGYRIALLFDENDICLGVSSEISS